MKRFETAVRCPQDKECLGLFFLLKTSATQKLNCNHEVHLSCCHCFRSCVATQLRTRRFSVQEKFLHKHFGGLNIQFTKPKHLIILQTNRSKTINFLTKVESKTCLFFFFVE